MEIKKIDKWFVLMVSILFIIIVFDMSVTLYGLNLGFTEGNPIIRYLFENIGTKVTAILYFIGCSIVFVGLIYIREKMPNENKIRMIYTIVGLLLTLRAFIVGTWFGLLVYKISGVA